MYKRQELDSVAMIRLSLVKLYEEMKLSLLSVHKDMASEVRLAISDKHNAEASGYDQS